MNKKFSIIVLIALPEFVLYIFELYSRFNKHIAIEACNKFIINLLVETLP